MDREADISLAINNLQAALASLGEGVDRPPEGQIEVSWVDVSTIEAKKFIPCVRVEFTATKVVYRSPI